MFTLGFSGTKKTDDMLKRIKSIYEGKTLASVDVGFFERSKYPTGESVAQIAYYNVYGTENIPARDFFLDVSNSPRLLPIFAKITLDISQDINKGNLYAVSSNVKRIAITASNTMKEAIIDLRQPPNAPATIKKKRSSNPLIDSGIMKNSVKWRIKWGE